MITLQQHIDQQHAGNKSAFARAVGTTRPTLNRWINSGAIWQAGRVWEPVTASTHKQAMLSGLMEVIPADQVLKHMHQKPNLQKGGFGADWVENGSDVILCPIGTANPIYLNAADLAAMTEAINNET